MQGLEALVSITDELREYTKHYSVAGSKKDTTLSSIADHIDAAHCKALGETAAAAYAEGVESVPIAVDENAWVRLPADADGVPIRPGDELVIFETGEHIRAYDVELYDDGRWLVCDDETMDSIHPDRLRHRAPTVEDVLRQFAREIDADAYGITDAKVAEFAAKLRLAGDE